MFGKKGQANVMGLVMTIIMAVIGAIIINDVIGTTSFTGIANTVVQYVLPIFVIGILMLAAFFGMTRR